jgi:hypothetical protein
LLRNGCNAVDAMAWRRINIQSSRVSIRRDHDFVAGSQRVENLSPRLVELRCYANDVGPCGLAADIAVFLCVAGALNPRLSMRGARHSSVSQVNPLRSNGCCLIVA